MQAFLYVELNCFALAVLLLIFLNIHRWTEQYQTEQKLFLALVFSNALILIADSGMWLLDGRPGQAARIADYFVTVIYYILNPLLPLLWYYFTDFHVFRSDEHLKKRLFPMLIPFGVNFVFTIMSIFGNVLFYFDERNVYHRGQLFAAVWIICLFYFLISVGLIVYEKSKIKENDYLPLLLFSLPPIIGAIIQDTFYGVSLIWICLTFSILMVFVSIQNELLFRDYLTNLFNRRQLDNFLQLKLQTNGKKLGGIMIDINSFKEINDFYGHISGDEALKYTAEILKKTFRKRDFVARYGGDEFIIILEIQDSAELVAAVARLKDNVESFNKKKILPFEFRLSIGYDVYPGDNMNDFIRHIDDLMYWDKQNSKHVRQTEGGEDY